MKLSVVVCSADALERLVECLTAIYRQAEADQVIVSDCSREDPSRALKDRFPNVEVAHFSERKTLPELRWAVLDRLRGDLIATLEARSAPAPDWRRRLIAAAERYPDADVIGGPVVERPRATPMALGMYFAEYADFAPPLPEGPAERVCESNAAYTRAAIERHRDFFRTGQWEHALRGQLRYVFTDARIEFRHIGMSFRQLCGQRFHYGRDHAATRIGRAGRAKGPLYALAAVFLPALLTYRAWRVTRGKLVGAKLGRALPWLLTFHGLWAAGELVGYLFGHARRKRIY